MATASPEAPQDHKSDIEPDIPGLRHAEEQGGLYNPDDKDNQAAGDAIDPKGEARSNNPSDKNSELKSAEESAGSGFYNPLGDAVSGAGLLGKGAGLASGPMGWWNTAMSGVLGVVGRNKKKAAFGGGIAGGIVAIIIAAFMAMVPLKIEHMMKNINKHFFAASEQAAEGMSETLLRRYLMKAVPSYKACGGTGATVSKNCRHTVSGDNDNPVTNLYRSWADAKLEARLAEQGVEFQRRGGAWYLKAPGTAANGDLITRSSSDAEFARKLDEHWQRSDRAGMRAAIKTSFENETRWKRVWLRYKVGVLAERKYGVKRCIFFCGTRDKLNDKLEVKRQAFKLMMLERVIAVRPSTTAIALGCIFDPSCLEKTKELQVNADGDPARGETNGAPTSEHERNHRGQLERVVEEMGGEALEELLKKMANIQKKGLRTHMVEEVGKKLFGGISEQAAQKVSTAIPVAGWINFASKLVELADDAGPAVKMIIYTVNATSAVQLYQMNQTYSDEIHTGNIDAAMVGSWTDALGSGSETSKGGPASAEQSPLYSEVMHGKSAGKTPDYLCEDGKPVPNGELVCAEEVIGQGNAITNTINTFMDSPGMAPLKATSWAWRHSVGYIFDGLDWALGEAAGAAFSAIDGQCSQSQLGGTISIGVGGLSSTTFCPAYNIAKAGGTKIGEAFMDFASEKLIPDPFGDDMGGGRLFQGMGAGSDILDKEACEQMGCMSVEPEAVASIVNERRAEEYAEFSKRPLFARLFDTSSDRSLITQLALKTPSTDASQFSNVAAGILKPIQSVANIFGNMFTKRDVFAASAKSVDPFKVGSMAFPKNQMPKDPEKYWEENNCGDTSENGPIHKWQKEAADQGDADKDPNTGLPTRKRVEPCLLILHSVGNVGGVYNSSLLTDDEQEVINRGSSTTGGSLEVAQADIDLRNLDKPSDSVACAEGTKDLGVKDGYTKGKKVRIRICAVSNFPGEGAESRGEYGVSGADGYTVVNSRVSGAVHAMIEAAKSDGVNLVSSSAFRTMEHQQALCPCDGVNAAEPGYSNHQLGVAIDFRGIGKTERSGPLWTWLDENAEKFGYKPYAHEAWHWSPRGN